MRLFYSGGNYNNSSYGMASFNGNNGRDNRNDNIGFRSASPSSQILRTYGFCLSATMIKGPVPPVRKGLKIERRQDLRSGFS